MASNAPTDATSSPFSFDVGAVLSDTFAFIRDRPLAVFGAALIVTIPVRLWLLFLPSALAPLNVTNYTAAYALGAGTSGFVAMAMGALGQGILVSAALARSRQSTVGLWQILLPAIRRWPVLTLVRLLYLLGAMAGLILLIVPGVMLSLMWSVAVPVAAAERTGIIETFRRSKSLTSDSLSRIFALTLIGGFGSLIFSFGARKLGESLFGVGANGLTYPFVPLPFLVGSLIDLFKTAFDLALICSLYVALLRQEGGSPLTDHLADVFA